MVSRLKHGIAEWLARVFLEYAVDGGSRDKRHPSTLPASVLAASDDVVSPVQLFGKVRSNSEGLVVIRDYSVDKLAWQTLFFQHISRARCSALARKGGRGWKTWYYRSCSSMRHVCQQ